MNKIQGFDELAPLLEYESLFHDGEVLRIEMDRTARSPSITLSILISKRAAANDLVSYIVTLWFDEIENLVLEGFNYQNVIQGTVIDEVGERLRVSFAGLFGVELSFTCATAKLLTIQKTSLETSHPFVPRSPSNR